jgi:Fe-S-cluster containining protein
MASRLPTVADSGTMVACQRCGVCCQAHVALLAHPEDRDRWQRERRWDILARVDAETHATDGMGDTALAGPCPFLERHGAASGCAIYPTRPVVCRSFQPGSTLCGRSRPPGAGSR